MKRVNKSERGIYQYLNSIGVLENGTDAEIIEARKKYWKEYKKKWKKEKQKESKTFEVIFNLQELNVIIIRANKFHTNPTNYIKQSALINPHGIVDRVALGELRELLVMYENTLQTISEDNIIPGQLGAKLLKQIALIKTKIFDFISPLIQQK